MSDLFADQPVNRDEMIAEAERELKMRQSVYPRQIAAGKMSKARAERAIVVQRAIVATLRNAAHE